MIRKTIIGGILFLLPIGILVIVLGKVFQIGLAIAEPIDKILPIERLAGVALVNVIAVLLILLVCYGAGLLATWRPLKDRVNSLDSFLVEAVPVYAFAKTMVASFAQAEEEAGVLKPVLVAFDDQSQIAFEVERRGEHAAIYLPGAPSPWSGSAVLVEASRVSPIDLSSHEAAKIMQRLGRGSVSILPERSAQAGGPPQ